MSIALVINGNTYQYPEIGDANWGQEATDWASAVTSGMLQKAGGNFVLLAEVDFGATFGLKSAYYKSRATNVGSAGALRLGNTDVINWRNFDNDGDLSLAVTTDDVLQYEGQNVLIAGLGLIVNADIAADAAIALTKLAATTVSRAIVSDGSGFLVPATTTATEIGYVNGVTSSIQTQLDSKQGSGSYITALTGNVTASGPGSAVATIASDVITNSMVNSAAAIAYSKLNLTGSIVNADVNASAAIAYSKLNLAGAIVNADVATGAAIAYSKLAALSSANILVGSAGNVATSVAMSGAIAIDNAGATTYSGTVALNKGGTGQTTKAPAFDALSPMTTGGDLIYGGSSGTGTRLANGSAGQVLTSQGTTLAPIWSPPGSAAAKMIAVNNGGQTISDTLIENWVVAQDTAGMMDVSNDYINIPTTGYYFITATFSVDIPASSPAVGFWAKIYVDSGGGFVPIALGNTWSAALTYAATLAIGSTVSRLCYLTATDKVAIYCEQNSGGSRVATGDSKYNHWSVIQIF